MTFETGLISAYDVKGGFGWLGDIEKDVTRSSQGARCLSRVIERTERYARDEHGHLTSYPFTGIDQSYSTNFQVFSVRAPNCVRLQLVEVRDNRLTVSPVAQFYINDGKVSGFDIHPSKDYILITSNKGKIYLFRIETGELRGTIRVPYYA